MKEDTPYRTPGEVASAAYKRVECEATTRRRALAAIDELIEKVPCAFVKEPR